MESSDADIIMNSYPESCAYCEKNLGGAQSYNTQLDDYVCLDCAKELKEQREKK